MYIWSIAYTRCTVQCAQIRLQNNRYIIIIIPIVRPVRARTYPYVYTCTVRVMARDQPMRQQGA